MPLNRRGRFIAPIASAHHVILSEAKNLAPIPTTKQKVCVIVPAFPVMGGVLTVLEGMEQAMQDVWRIEYLTQHVGADLSRPSYAIHRFGTRRMTPWYFPFAWLYVLAGAAKLGAMNRPLRGRAKLGAMNRPLRGRAKLGAMNRSLRKQRYDLLLPQDGIFSAALAGLVGKVAGTRVVCIDHGDISLFTPRNQRVYRAERRAAVAAKGWPWFVRLGARALLLLYWPSRLLAARLAARFVDHYLIPGVIGDSSDEGCKVIGIPVERVTRYPSMIDIEQHRMPDAAEQVARRAAYGLPADALVVAIVCRLAPEKGLDIALASIEDALARLAPESRARVRVLIAGDGPERAALERETRRRGLDHICRFLGELALEDARALLSISDIFLYTSTRGACMAMAVLEAMASSCAVIASTEPLANEFLLAEGRGLAVPAGDAAQTSDALLLLLNDAVLRQRMGMLAREYIRDHHSPAMFRRVLLAASHYGEEVADCGLPLFS
jgi:glycosyltransferase involved in cell wall biosynthesis